MPKEFKKEMTMSAVSDSPYDSVHYASWTSMDEYEGGDYHSFYRLPRSRFGVLLGDVPESGENGTIASVNVMFYVNHVIKEDLARAREEGRVLDSRRCVEHANRLILDDSSFDAGMYPLLFSTFNMETGSLKIVNAGMPYPIILPRKGAPRLEECDGHFPLGVMEMECHYHRVFLEPGDRVFFCTDGLDEAGARKGRPIPMERVLDLIQKTRDVSFDRALMRIGKYVRGYALRHSSMADSAGNPMLEDDITLSGFACLKRSLIE